MYHQPTIIITLDNHMHASDDSCLLLIGPLDVDRLA